MTDLRYPIGRYRRPDSLDDSAREDAIARIGSLPLAFRRVVDGLDVAQLDTPYREGGWTVRQLVHHLPDSHLNAYVRFHFALTEERPTIRPYDEAAWAALPDTHDTPTELSLTLLDALHARWVALLHAMAPANFSLRLEHPESGEWTLDQFMTLYAWHGEHHVAHVSALRERLGWS